MAEETEWSNKEIFGLILMIVPCCVSITLCWFIITPYTWSAFIGAILPLGFAVFLAEILLGDKYIYNIVDKQRIKPRIILIVGLTIIVVLCHIVDKKLYHEKILLSGTSSSPRPSPGYRSSDSYDPRYYPTTPQQKEQQKNMRLHREAEKQIDRIFNQPAPEKRQYEIKIKTIE
ncbi:hypothetical protein [Desulfomonile tiedjei]|uniref:hypothetical protein n=1 Tax=Desulfomonile tiedjei TaxID=2358 RepID=UPI00059D83C8|nr:hypothetical protein [Desulfomonile tiedjei]